MTELVSVTAKNRRALWITFALTFTYFSSRRSSAASSLTAWPCWPMRLTC